MANRTVYVTGSASGTPGTNGATYATLAAAISGEVGAAPDLVTDTCILSIEISKTGADTGQVDVDGFTTSASYYVHIYTAASARHAGVWSTNKYRLTVTDAHALILNDPYVRIDGLQISKSGTSEWLAVLRFNVSGTSDVRVSNCLFQGIGGASYGERGVACDANGTLTLWNNVFYNISTKSGSVGLYGYVGTITAYNCVFIGGQYAVSSQDGTATVVIKNCYAGGSTSGDFYRNTGSLAKTNCASSDGTADDTGTNHTASNCLSASILVSTTADSTHAGFTNVSAGTEDFHLISASSPLYGAGADPSGGFTTDIDGDTISGRWDIGADWFAASSPTLPVSLLRTRAFGIDPFVSL